MHLLRACVFTLCLCFTGSSRGNDNEILVSAAASLKDAFREISSKFEKSANVKVRFNFAASGILQKQIEAGAPVDVFASAGEKQMDALEAKHLLAESTRRNFARNELVLVIPRDEPNQFASFADLTGPRMKRLAIGNPKTVPAGRYAEQLLRNLALWEALEPRFVFGEDVRQVLDYVARGEVAAGIVYATDVILAKEKVAIAARAPEDSHELIVYPIAVIKASRNVAVARRFIEFVLSEDGQEVLRKYGFQPVL